MCHPFGKFDAKRVRLLGFHDIVVFDGDRHVRTRVLARQKDVGRLGQYKAWNVIVDICNGGVIVRSGLNVWGVV